MFMKFFREFEFEVNSLLESSNCNLYEGQTTLEKALKITIFH